MTEKDPSRKPDESERPDNSPESESTTFSIPGTDKPVDRVGPYRLLSKLGEGGMGIVYLAEQKVPLQRRVALKVIKLGMDTREVIARFEAERMALAMMNHPNIAKILDAGSTETGRPYFVMEYVAGLPITHYCDRNRLSTKERLQLLVPVFQAVHHAHQKGIIHRDIKPPNILVSIQDGKLVPKVIDFGVAKATEKHLTEKTIFTEEGQLIGSPEYMSPEQAEMTGLNIDITTDVYSLGVVLYELLTGSLPFRRSELLRAGLGGIQQVIREVNPPKPSTRISSLGDEATSIAARRRTVPPSLHTQLRGELDWITMRAMEKDRTRRYVSAAEFADDILRFLGSEPVLAAPPSRIYLMRKFASRHKAMLFPISVLSCLLLAASIFSIVGFLKARESEQVANLARLTAENRAQDSETLASHLFQVQKEVFERDRVLALDIAKRRFAEGITEPRASHFRAHSSGHANAQIALDLPFAVRPALAIVSIRGNRAGGFEGMGFFKLDLGSSLAKTFMVVERGDTWVEWALQEDRNQVIEADYFVIPQITIRDDKARIQVDIVKSGSLAAATVLSQSDISFNDYIAIETLDDLVSTIREKLERSIYLHRGEVIEANDHDLKITFESKPELNELIRITGISSNGNPYKKGRAIIVGSTNEIYSAVLFSKLPGETIVPGDLVYSSPEIFTK